MAASAPRVTAYTAPRTVEGLESLGVFRLRFLFGDLGGLETAEQKEAFAKMEPKVKAQVILDALHAWDAQNPGAAQHAQQQQGLPMQPPPQQQMAPPSMAPPQMAPPPHTNGAPPMQNGYAVPPQQQQMPQQGWQGQPQQPPQQQQPQYAPPQMGQQPQYAQPPGMMPQQGMMPPQVSQVDPGAIAAAAAATGQPNGAPAPTGRQPRNSKKNTEAAPAPSGGDEILQFLANQQAEQAAASAAIQNALNAMNANLTALAQKPTGGDPEIANGIKAIQQQYGGIYSVMSGFDARLTAMQRLSTIGVALSLFYAENVLGMGRTDILRAALGEVATIDVTIQDAAAGK